MSLVDTIIGIAVLLIVFTALISAFTSAVEFSARNRLRSTALHLANRHIETIRALPFDTIGTVAGLPSGTIPQIETVTQGGATYTRRTFIQYVDDPADGLGAADSLAADYKRIKVEMSYDYHGVAQTFSLTTTIAPKSQESLAGAGILRINVTDATNNPLSGASVHVLNTTVATSVDITTFTNTSGTVSFPGAWAGAGYTITVTKPGYSLAQTYAPTVANPNPSPSAATVAENSTTEIYFKIDLLSSLAIETRAWPTRNRFIDTFDDATGLASLTDIQVLGGVLTLAGAPGTYPATGEAVSVPFTPADVGSWLVLSHDATRPAGTTLLFTVEYDSGGGVFVPVPDTDVPGNAAGLSAPLVDLTGLDATTYTSLRLRALFTSTDTSLTPELTEWKLSYLAEDVPLGNVPFSLTGSKTIGTDGSGNPVYKYDLSTQTDAGGTWTNGAMEWDEYTLTVPGYTVAEACPTLPLILDPDTNRTQILTLETPTAHSLHVQVNNTADAHIPYAEVHVVGGAVDEVRAAGPCGVAFFPGLAAETYTITVEVPGYTEHTQTVDVSGGTSATVTLTPS
jgi:hypothetical protein